MNNNSIRKQIRKTLDVEPTTTGNYDKLKSCLIVKEGGLDTRIDDWFKGCVESLYFRPNKLVLVLLGDRCIGKSTFINKINHFSVQCELEDAIYHNMIMETKFTKNNLNIAMDKNFTTELGEYPCDKRFTSYCTAVEYWGFPQRKDFVIIELLKVDIEKLLTIDSLSLWIEIYNKFRMYQL